MTATFRPAIAGGKAASWPVGTGNDPNAVQGPWFNNNGHALVRANGTDWQFDNLSFSVQAFGAKGDGVTDDTTPIANTLAAASAAGGGIVLFPPGTYVVSSTLSIPSNVVVQGAGPGATIISATIAGGGSSAAVFLFNNVTSSALFGLKISGAFAQGVFIFQGSQNRLADLEITGATNTSTVDTGGVMMQDATYVTIERIYCHGNGVAAAGSYTDIGTYGGSTSNHHITISNCRCISTAVNYNIGMFNTSRSVAEKCYCTGAILNNGSTAAGGYGIMFYKTGGAVEFGQNHVEDNDVDTTQGSGIYMQAQPNSNVEINRCKNNCTAQLATSLQTAGIAVGTAAAGAGAGTVNGVTVVGNTISGSSQAGISAGGDNNVIADNAIDNCTDAGIILRDLHRSAITGNTIQTCGGGIVWWNARSAGDGTDNINCSDNMICSTVSLSGSPQPGIWVSGAGGQVELGDNFIFAANGHGILIDSANTVNCIGSSVYSCSGSADNSFDGILINASTFVRVAESAIRGSRHRFGINATGAVSNLRIGQNQCTAGHAILGGVLGPYRTSASVVTVTSADMFVGVTGNGARTVNLPATTTLDPGQQIIIQDIGNSAGIITINPSGVENINSVNGAVTIAAAFGRKVFVTDGAGNWWTDVNVI